MKERRVRARGCARGGSWAKRGTCAKGRGRGKRARDVQRGSAEGRSRKRKREGGARRNESAVCTR